MRFLLSLLISVSFLLISSTSLACGKKFTKKHHRHSIHSSSHKISKPNRKMVRYTSKKSGIKRTLIARSQHKKTRELPPKYVRSQIITDKEILTDLDAAMAAPTREPASVDQDHSLE